MRRNPISCLANPEAAACAAFAKESRMKIANPTNTNRKSGDRPTVLPPRHTPDFVERRATAERDRRKVVHASNPDRKTGRKLVKDCALSRFGLEVGKMERQSLIRRVQKGDVKYARKLTNSRTVIVLDYADSEMAFLYSSATKEIVSFLPPDAPEIAGWRGSQAAALALFGRGPEGTNK